MEEITLHISDIIGNSYDVIVTEHTTISELATMCYNNVNKNRKFNRYANQFYAIKNDTERLDWGSVINQEKTILNNELEDGDKLVVIYSKSCHSIFPLCKYIVLKDMTGLRHRIMVYGITDFSSIAEKWNEITASNAADFFYKPLGEDPLDWKKTIDIYEFEDDSEIFVLCDNKTHNQSKFEHKISSNYCETCDGTFFCRGNCMTCASNAGFNINEICFAGDGIVQLQNEQSIYIYQLQVGDSVKSRAGFSTINKIFKTPSSIERKICTINGVTLTDEHPIFINSEWIYPKYIANVYTKKLSLYNFEMKGDQSNKDNHTIIVNGLTCATLGCGPDNLKDRNPAADKIYGSGYWD